MKEPIYDVDALGTTYTGTLEWHNQPDDDRLPHISVRDSDTRMLLCFARIDQVLCILPTEETLALGLARSATSSIGIHDDRCAKRQGHPCNCASAALTKGPNHG